MLLAGGDGAQTSIERFSASDGGTESGSLSQPAVSCPPGRRLGPTAVVSLRKCCGRRITPRRSASRAGRQISLSRSPAAGERVDVRVFARCLGSSSATGSGSDHRSGTARLSAFGGLRDSPQRLLGAVADACRGGVLRWLEASTTEGGVLWGSSKTSVPAPRARASSTPRGLALRSCLSTVAIPCGRRNERCRHSPCERADHPGHDSGLGRGACAVASPIFSCGGADSGLPFDSDNLRPRDER